MRMEPVSNETLRRLHKLYELGALHSDDPLDIFAHIASTIAEVFEVPVVCLAEINGENAQFTAFYKDGAIELDGGGCKLAGTPCEKVAASKSIRVYNDALAQFPDARCLRAHNGDSYCGVPILDANGEVVAVTYLLDDKPHEYSEDDRQLLTVLGNRIASEFVRKQGLEQQRRIEQVILALAKTDSSFQGDDLYRACAEQLARLYNVRYALLGFVMDKDMRQVRTHGLYADGRLVDDVIYDLKGTPCENVLDRRQEFIASHAQQQFPDDVILQAMGVEGYFGTPLIDSNGDVMGLIAIMDDKPMQMETWSASMIELFTSRVISERERQLAEECIINSEVELNTILSTIRETFYRSDTDGVLQRISSSVEKLLGYQPHELLGTRLADLYLLPEDHEAYLRALEEGEGLATNHEAMLRHKDGAGVWASTNAHFIRDERDCVIGIEATVRDITQRRLAEAQMRKLSGAIEQSADIVIITDINGVIEYANPAFARTTGYECDEAVGRGMQLLKSGAMDKAFFARMWDCLLGGEVFSDVLINRKKDGQLYYEEKTITPLKDERQHHTLHLYRQGHHRAHAGPGTHALPVAPRPADGTAQPHPVRGPPRLRPVPPAFGHGQKGRADVSRSGPLQDHQ